MELCNETPYFKRRNPDLSSMFLLKVIQNEKVSGDLWTTLKVVSFHGDKWI